MAKRVLVVDDDTFLALDVQTVLTDAGFAVIGPAYTAEEALNLVQETTPDAAVLDFNLHKGTSAPVAERLLKLSVPFLFLTGYSENAMPVELRHHPRISKPFRDEALIEGLETLMDG